MRVDNLPAVRLYEKLGFAREGIVRDAVFVDGEYHDALAMAIVDSTQRGSYDELGSR